MCIYYAESGLIEIKLNSLSSYMYYNHSVQTIMNNGLKLQRRIYINCMYTNTVLAYRGLCHCLYINWDTHKIETINGRECTSLEHGIVNSSCI